MSNTKYHTARLTCYYYGGEQVVGGSSWLNGLTIRNAVQLRRYSIYYGQTNQTDQHRNCCVKLSPGTKRLIA